MCRLAAAAAFSILVAWLGAGSAAADTQSCADFRKTILDMESRSVRPPGWVMLDSIVRWQYARDCVLSPTRKAEREYWFRIDGSPTGVKATCVDAGESDCVYRPEDGAYAATPEIGAFCAKTTNPSMCAMVKRVEAACLKPVDTQERVQCESILGGRVPDLPPASEPMPPIADLLAPKGAKAPQMPDAQVAADPGFQRMCQQADANFNTCATRRQNMTTLGTGGLGSDGQAGAFYQCQRLYQGVLNMCHSTKIVAAKTMPAAPVAPPPPPTRPADGTAHSAPPPKPPAPPQQPQMSAQCQQLVSNYVGAAQANDGARALAGYNALKSAGGCGVLDKVDSGPPPTTAAAGDPRFPTRRATPLTDSYVQPCNANEAGCAQAMRQLEQATSPEAKSALVMHAISTGLQLGAAVANGLAAGMPQPGVAVGGGGGGGTNMNSIGNRPVRSTYGQGAPTGPVQRNTPSDITGTK